MTTPLAELDVLALDCQATAPNPRSGHLLEIGWSAGRAADPAWRVEAQLFQLPEGAAVPSRVRRVTGLDEAALAHGLAPEQVWPSVVDTARAIAERNRETRCATVIHFSRFEEPYVRWLEDRAGTSFPLAIVCTHEIVRRLLPALPRRGLRAVAGYFGHAVSELRRASQHVLATAAVWRSAVTLLEQKEGVRTFDDLDAWLRLPRRRSTPARAYPMPADQRRNLPDRPGVYRMLRANGDVLYVGKATSLRQRVRSYFQPRARHAEHILEMLSQARELELTVTGSALEAALEEADAIKQLSPPYNKALRPGERAIVFASPTLDRVAGTPDRVHRLGPLAGRDLWKALELLARHDTSASPAEALAVPEAYAPAAPTLAAGVERFRAGLGTSSLLAHGARLWRARIAEREQEDEFRLEMQYDTGVDRWTPERVASALDDLVCRGAHQARRSHWLCLVSEATLVWDGIALEIAGGRVRSRGGPIVERTTAYPDFHERRRGLDLDTYDRLIVLTREIRRLVAEDRAVRLHVGPSTALANEQLKAWFQWI